MLPRNNIVMGVVLTLVATAYPAPTLSGDAPNIAWVRQFGSAEYDKGYAVTLDQLGNAYVSGATEGDLNGTNAGGSDAFLSKYGPSGDPLWTRHVGTSADDFGFGVAADSLGNILIAGRTDGSLDGRTPEQSDAFLRKYDPYGNCIWTRQLGTEAWDMALDVATDDSGNSYITGYTTGSLGEPNVGSEDVFVAKYDQDGELIWTRLLGTHDKEKAESVAVDSLGNAWISGYTNGSIEGTSAGDYDAFLAKYDSTGNLMFKVGYTQGGLDGSNAGGLDFFITKYNPVGTLLWTRQFGSVADDQAFDVAVDSLGCAYVTGRTLGILGDASDGGYDATLTKYDTSGQLLWSWQLGTDERDEGWGIVVGSQGCPYVVGFTEGDLAGSGGGQDVILVKLVPEPTLVSLLIMSVLTILLFRTTKTSRSGPWFTRTCSITQL